MQGVSVPAGWRPVWRTFAAALAAVAGSSRPSTASAEDIRDASRDLDSRWILREHCVTGGPPVKLLESRFVFVDGAGAYVWPASRCLASYLWHRDPDTQSGDAREPLEVSQSTWRGCSILELGCGCGYLCVVLARWGAKVLATDCNSGALALAKANAALHNQNESMQLQLQALDWTDLEACAQLRKDAGPFDAIVISDGVLVVPPSGAMWHQAGDAERMVSLPGPLLDATRLLGYPSAEVILAVVDRAGDVQETARALLDRRHWLEIVGFPRDLLADDGSTKVTIFHFRWKNRPDVGSDVTRKLWSNV